MKIHAFLKINLFFIGYKAGLLECLPELNQLIKKKHVNIKIAAVSLSLETLQKAEFVKNKSYKFGILNNHKIKNVNKAFQIVKLVEEEFDYAENSGFNKYHAWTNVLSKNVLSKMISQLSNNEKIKYDNKYFTRLRNITRFTYPYPLEIKDKMLKENSLRLIKDKFLSIKSFSNYILIL